MQTAVTKKRTTDIHRTELLDMKPPPRKSTDVSCGLPQITIEQMDKEEENRAPR
jgi:hypothetical protein